MKKVKLTYFKDNGKYYSVGEYESSFDFDYDIYTEVRVWAGGLENLGSLPGLSSHSWDGYVLVSPVDGVPALIDVCEGGDAQT